VSGRRLLTATALVVLTLGEALKAPSLAPTFGMIFFGISLVLSVLGMVIVSNCVYRGEPEVPKGLRGVAALFVMGLVAFVQEAAFGVL
jgi:hypothetical protein